MVPTEPRVSPRFVTRLSHETEHTTGRALHGSAGRSRVVRASVRLSEGMRRGIESQSWTTRVQSRGANKCGSRIGCLHLTGTTSSWMAGQPWRLTVEIWRWAATATLPTWLADSPLQPPRGPVDSSADVVNRASCRKQSPFDSWSRDVTVTEPCGCSGGQGRAIALQWEGGQACSRGETGSPVVC